MIAAVLKAQSVQTIRGHVTDKDSKTSLPGANVVLLNVQPLTGTVTDADGDSDDATVTINVKAGINNVPVAVNDNATTIINQSVERGRRYERI